MSVQLSERITAWRESRNMTQAELARRVKKSSAAISQWESGDTQPTHDSVEAMCDVFEITVAEFWGTPPKRRAKAS